MYMVTIWHGSRVYRLFRRTWNSASAAANAFADMGWSTQVTQR